MKPKTIADHLLIPTFSFKNIKAKIVTALNKCKFILFVFKDDFVIYIIVKLYVDLVELEIYGAVKHMILNQI